MKFPREKVAKNANFQIFIYSICEYNLVNRIKRRVFCTLNIFFYGFLSDNGLTD